MGILGDSVRLGILTLPSTWIALLTSGIIVLWLLRKGLNKRGFHGSEHVDQIITSIFFGFLAYKLTPILMDPEAFISHPKSALLEVGPSYGLWIGFGITLGYLLFKVVRVTNPIALWLEAWIVPVGIGVVLYSILIPEYGRSTWLPWGASLDGVGYHPTNIYRAISWSLVAWVAWRLPVRSAERIGIAIFLYGASELFVSWFDFHLKTSFGLATDQWLTLLIMCAGAVGFMLANRLQVNTECLSE